MSDSNLRKLKVVFAGYFVVAVFVVAFRSIHTFDSFESHTALLFAGIIASPLVIAFIWDRLTKIKIGEVEINLDTVTPTVDHALSALFGFKFDAAKVSKLGQPPKFEPLLRSVSLGSSLEPEILRQIKSAIEQADVAKLAEIDLGLGDSWWVTRLYLLAALADDYTKISHLVFMETRGDRDRCFLGIASPTSTRYALATIYPLLEQAYRIAHSDCFVGIQPKIASPNEQVECVVQNFGMHLQQLKPEFLRQASEAVLIEDGREEWVTKQILERCLSLYPEAHKVVWEGGAVTPFLLRQILDRSGQFVVLVENEQVKKVVDKMEIAIQFTNTVLKQNVK